ncbi:hypothetical protein B0H13DRAFT_2359355 [Mycena leptocephala]|nr:hypothetical protein B0H13DRAFT_2359355 [Mycena leptocephala]
MVLLDMAVRYALGGDAVPDRSMAPIWLLGIQLPGLDESAWPAAFYAQVWCTYRTGFETVRDLPSLSSLPPPLSFHPLSNSTSTSASVSTSKKPWWPLGGTKEWTSDAGWGSMLRTGQSLLAVALQRVGADPLPNSNARIPPRTLAVHAAHARLISWFLDAPAAPFSVHRMALAGKALGKDVGMWFGPSAAASTMRTLVDAFPACGLGVSVATDATLYQSEVFAASYSPAALHSQSHGNARSPASSAAHASLRRHSSYGEHGKPRGGKPETQAWGDRPVLVLLPIRLGLDGVNPVYHEIIKTLPQTVGIAGGRPSSSYHLVGVQGDDLFYLDPHLSQPAVPLRPFVPDTQPHAPMTEDGLVFDRRASSATTTAEAADMTTSTDADRHMRTWPRAGCVLSPAEEAHFARAYSVAELRTFHCTCVRKMPLTLMDPSMLLGFVCRDAEEWADWRRRVRALPRAIFAIQDEPTVWPGAYDDDDRVGTFHYELEDEAITDDEDMSLGVSNASHVAVSGDTPTFL